MKKHFLKSLLMLLFMPLTSAFAAEGDTVVVLNQNFDVFTEGSETNPATTDISSYSSNKLRTVLPNWSGSKVYEAGGSLKIGDNGYLQTANTDMSANGGYLKISFRAKALDATGGSVQLLLNSSYTVTTTVYLEDGEWTDVVVMAGGGKTSGYLRIKPYLIASGILIDNLKIEASQSFIGAPEATQPTQANGTSFTATWKVVSGADSYLLDVYNKNGDTKEYVLQNESVAKPSSTYATTQSKQVTGLDASKKYYFTVRAKRGEHVSDYSNEIMVVKVISSVNTPVANEATEVTENGFTANWNAVDEAEGYIVKVYKNEVLTEDATITVLHDDFSGFTSGSLISPEYPSSSTLNQHTSVPGWTASMSASAAGYFGISPYGTTPGYICTPAIDLSKGEGKFKVTMKAAAYYYGTMKDDSVKVYIYNSGSEPVDSATIQLSGNFTDYVFESTKGAAETYIYIQYQTSNNVKFFMDEFTVTQDMKAGEVLNTLVETEDAGNVTSYHFELPFSEGVSYSYTVQAYAPTVTGSSYTGYYVTDLYSEESNKIDVNATTGITTIDHEQLSIDNNAWYTINGIRLNSMPTQNGVYIHNGKKVIIRQK